VGAGGVAAASEELAKRNLVSLLGPRLAILLQINSRKGVSLEEWRAKAFEHFPDLRELIEEQTGPMGLWVELYLKLLRAYDREPLDEERIGKIYEYASWCLMRRSTGDAWTDPSSAVAVGFIEDLPHDDRVASDLFRWMSAETFDDSEKLFRYSLSDEEFERFAAVFRQRKKDFKGPSRL
jgi:hypothetical protein